MIYYVLESPFLPLLVLVLSFYGLRWLTGRIQVNEFDSIGQLNLNTAFSLSSLTALSVLGYVDSDNWLLIGSLYVIFYVVVWITSVLTMDRKLAKKQDLGFDRELFSDHRYQYMVATITGVILALSSLFFVYILVTQSLSGDDRIALAKDYRVMDIIRRGFATVFTYYSISCFLYKRDRYLLGLVIFNIAVGFFSGSKSFVVEYLTAYITIDTLIKGRSQVSFKKYLPLIAIVLTGTVGTVMFWQNVSFADAWISIFNRLFACGDIFYYSFIHNNYKNLFGEYDFWSYIAHPFTSLFGMRGYEHPIGSLLYVRAGEEIKGFGPNPQLPMTAIILLQGNFWLSSLFCGVMGIILVLSRNFALKVLQMKSLPTVLRTSVFAICFVKSAVILVDFSLLAIDLIAVFAMTGVTLMFQRILDRRELIEARRTEKLQALMGNRVKTSPKLTKKYRDQKIAQQYRDPPVPVPPTKSKKIDQIITTTMLHQNKLKKLAELLNIKTKFK
jgi:hypothetical protein